MISEMGLPWHHISGVICNNCGAKNIVKDFGKSPEMDHFQLYIKKDGFFCSHRFQSPNQPCGKERAEKSLIPEYWVQQYIKDKHKTLGITKIEGPFEYGPDFKGKYANNIVEIEAERNWKSYLDHGHNKDVRFDHVKILIILSPDEPPNGVKNLLPDIILHIDIDDFTEYWRPKSQKFALSRRGNGIIWLIEDYFKRRYVQEYSVGCPDIERDMANCPNCAECPYFEIDLKTPFWDMAFKYIVTNDFDIFSPDFELTKIEPIELDKFYTNWNAV
jgi:hypothetical protein